MNKKILILVVEDEKILSDKIEEKLLLEGFDVAKSFNGLEGLNLALSEHPDLILLDLLMPKIDGLTMLKKLRQDSWGLNANVIVMSNLSDPRKFTEGEDFGLDSVSDYIIKTNWSLEDIVSQIKKRLNIKS